MDQQLDADEYLWLEELDSVEASGWVAENNERMVAATGGAGFAALREEIRQVLDDDHRIPYPRRRAGFLYNFWRDGEHPRGVWRRTTPQEYATAAPVWEVLLDVDALAAAEGENWVWHGAAVLRPAYERALVSLSRGGADATVVREFDLVGREFVADGFVLPEAKSSVHWVDADHVFVGTDTGPGSMTVSGYPRVIRLWRRGTPLEESVVVFEGEPGDVLVDASRHLTPGFERSFVRRSTDFFHRRIWQLTDDGGLVRIEVPDDAVAQVHREWLLVRLRTPWQVGGVVFSAGALLAARYDEFVAGGRDLTVLFEPDERTALSTWSWTQHHLVLNLLVDVATRLEVLTPGDGGWERSPLIDATDLSSSYILDTHPDDDDDYLLVTDGFLEPATLRQGRLGGSGPEVLKQAPGFFDPAGMTVEQHFAVSADGTRVPYFVIGDPAARPGPALLTGYGGFANAKLPGYEGVTGRAWLARGGTYVVANIRGGGEYGPAWHHAAQRERRPRAFEDFAAIAQDLVTRGVTTAAQLGVDGRSNGGLLTGVMLTRYPELFGAIVIGVPLLDMRRFHKLLAGASWMAEYGDPDNPDDWEFLRGYSPYQNVRAGQAYPPVLLITSTRDDRVHPGHARKMAARLLAHGYDVSYYENVEGGHGTAADSSQRAFLTALKFDFLWRTLRPEAS
ncbi:prolyl oligopeptidase [Allocatelliglobosispora scoriae]|uniref:Prolyl oligopeptidase n=1 Tax=Allocatelliglobosispora scoriae TaxID=643052 RepID=A0A841BIV0_9ACTN|nr:prolyl oligopeptidase family serine peptidase [Allocatelliglobosispora scoriae]MBB5867126.1 prolyl oligopeptidase [Allocatelliglobosispora scoriae]